jgi:microcompartment protein CcmL/EutN
LLGIEQVGAGLVSVRFSGEIAAVQVAVQAGVAAALKITQVISHHVIPALHLDLKDLIETQPPSPHDPAPAAPAIQPALGELDDLPVARLRSLVRQLPDARLKGREVSRANKKALIAELRRAWYPDA